MEQDVTGRQWAYETDKQEVHRLLLHLKHQEMLSSRQVASWVTEFCKDYERIAWRFKEITGMAKTEYNNADFKGFINISLTSDEKELFSQWDLHDMDLLEVVASRIQGGYKLSCGYNHQNDTFTASWTCAKEKDPNKGYILPAFAKTWYHAVRVLVFKDAMLLGGDWQNAKDRVSDNIG